MIEGIASLVAWLGASLIVLADGRRGLALGTALAAAGLALVTWPGAGPVPAAILALGGGIAAARRSASGPVGWALMPPGSTPRLILCVASALVALWIALGITSGEGTALRFAALVVIGLAGARVLSSTDPQVQLSAAAVLALAIGAAAGLASGGDLWPYVASAALAAGACWLPMSAPRAA